MAVSGTSVGDRWARLLTDEAWRAITAAGLEDCAYFAYFFTSTDEAREWCILNVDGASSDTFVIAWSQCRQLLDADQDVVERIFRREQQRVRGAAPKRMPDLPNPAPEPSTAVGQQVLHRRKRRITDSITGYEQLQVHIRDEAHKAVYQIAPEKKIWNDIWAIWLQSGTDNLRYQELVASFAPAEPPLLQNCVRQWVFSRLLKYDEPQLRPAVRAWQRWSSWATNSGAAVSSPDTMSVFNFLSHVAEGGPTAARTVWNQLLFLRKRLGVNLPLEDSKDFVFGRVQAGAPSQARVADPGILLGLLVLLQRAGGSAKTVIQAVLLPMLSCLRWRHLQRSYFSHEDDKMWYGTCLRGKRRVQGVCPPYDWCVPKDVAVAGLSRGLSGNVKWLDGLGDVYAAIYPTLPAGQQPFLIPAFLRDKSSAWASAFVTNSKMSYRAWVELFRGVLVQLGYREDADGFTYNSVRRFMPTLAGLLELDPQQAQALGYWQEIVKPQQGIGSGTLSSARASFPMSQRYSGVKVMVTARIQMSMLAIFFAMAKKAMDTIPAKSSKWWLHESLTWANFGRFRLTPTEVDNLLQEKGDHLEPGRTTCCDQGDSVSLREDKQQLFEIFFTCVIQLHAADGGLTSCWAIARVKVELQNYMRDILQMASLHDFFHFVAASAWEAELDSKIIEGAVTAQIITTAERQLQLARLRMSWQSASKCLDAASAAGSSSTDRDEPLPDSTRQMLEQNWKARYNEVTLEPALTASSSIVHRIYREWRQGAQATVLNLSKMKTALAERFAGEKVQLSLGGATLTLSESTASSSVSFRSVQHFYLVHRCLTNAWAFIGNFETQSAGDPAKKVLAMGYSQALNYSDFVLRKSCEAPPSVALSWITRTDIKTRERMVHWQLQQHPPGEALAKAISDTVEWSLIPSEAAGVSGPSLGPVEAFNDDRRCSKAGVVAVTVVERPVQAFNSVEEDAASGAKTERTGVRRVMLGSDQNRGRGELVQYPWSCTGTWILVDLWSGIGSTILACLALGLRIFAVSVEQDPVAAERAAHSFPNVVSMQYVEEFKGCMLREILRKRSVEGVIVGGENPFQGSSRLSRHRSGPQESRSLQPEQIVRIAHEIAELDEARGVKIRTFLESVASCPTRVIEYYNNLLEAKPLRINASQFGYVQRNRLFWIGSLEDFQSVRWPAGIAAQEQEQWWDLVIELAKPVPHQIHLERGFTLRIDPKANLLNQRLPRIYSFTQEFHHSEDDAHSGTAQAVARFRDDSCRFPVEAYEEVSLAWKQQEWRTFTPAERAAMHGIPPDAVSSATLQDVRENSRTKIRNGWVGKGSHIPCLILVVWAMVAEGARVPKPMQCVSEQHLLAHIPGSPFDVYALQGLPGMMSAEDLVYQVKQIFHAFPGSDLAPWDKVPRRLQGCDLHLLFSYRAFTIHRGLDDFSEGPSWEGQKNRALLQAALGVQRAPGDSNRGLDHLLPSPFALDLPVDTDLDFARTASTALAREDQVSHHSTRRPLALAVFTVLLKWPDVNQPLRYLTGFEVVGDVEHSGVFRGTHNPATLESEEFMGDSANDFIDGILHSRPSKDAKVIWDLTLEEQTKGWCTGPFTRQAMDKQFGSGRWRPVPRFLVTQPCGKQRLIDDAKKGCHNQATAMTETIYTIGVDLLPVVVRNLARRVMQINGFRDTDSVDSALAALPSWFSPTLAVMDLPDAYRGCPVHPDQTGSTVVAVYSEEAGAWRFFVYNGLLYGLASAVLSFNRLPTLLVATARRILAISCGAYFDDIFDLSFTYVAKDTMNALLHVLNLAGAPPAASKTQDPAPSRVYLGAAVDFTEVQSEGIVTCGPTTSSTSRIVNTITELHYTKYLSSAQAAKLRGQAGWSASLMHGKCGRLALNFLKQRQYQQSGDFSLQEHQLQELDMLSYLAQHAPPKRIAVLGVPRPPLLVYSDASFEAGIAVCGWVVFDGDSQPIGQTVTLPDSWLRSWEDRATQIFPAEAFCAVLTPFNLPDVFRNRDVLWFIDNEAAASACIRGSSGSRDVDSMVRLAHVMSAKSGTRIWYEWVNSTSNPADGLSRGGLSDPWTLAQGWSLSYGALPEISTLDTLDSTLDVWFVPRDQVDAKEATPKKRGPPKEAKPKPKSPKLKEKAEKVAKVEKPKAKAKSKGKRKRTEEDSDSDGAREQTSEAGALSSVRRSQRLRDPEESAAQAGGWQRPPKAEEGRWNRMSFREYLAYDREQERQRNQARLDRQKRKLVNGDSSDEDLQLALALSMSESQERDWLARKAFEKSEVNTRVYKAIYENMGVRGGRRSGKEHNEYGFDPERYH
ncbi:hypothetical protein AK812_SmicGene42982 [Symbiodinium microadriaticum]|uniref:Uncharacterized protein n=1 Tax=Symbiodinium microadriaticum TaxID=2951 RepID=A0A1Q9C253_SYMMI|nr:hypothetical protein AK812_SmicGene42982 [Symbiodinium microadriaticum]